MNERQFMEAEEGRKRMEEERMRKAAGQERKRQKKEDTTGRLLKVKDLTEYNCPHCGFTAKANEMLSLQFFYCKRCKEVQTQPTKQVVETIKEKEYRGFWQWLMHKPTGIKREVHADIVPCDPRCHKCNRSDMMVPFDQDHCPACGNLLERHDNLFSI